MLDEEELTEAEREERRNGVPPPFMDWNKLSLDDMVEYLERQHMFSSSGESLCIFKLIEFYKSHKEDDKTQTS